MIELTEKFHFKDWGFWTNQEMKIETKFEIKNWNENGNKCELKLKCGGM